MPALVMFDSGATHSFVSLSFCAYWDRESEDLGHILMVDVADGRTVSVSSIYRGCIMELSGTKFEIDLIPIAMKELCVVVGMDWLHSVRAVIDCYRKQVQVRTPSGGELLVQGSTVKYSKVLRTAARARKYLLQSGKSFLAYVRDTREIFPAKSIGDVPVAREFADLFPEDLPGIPPEPSRIPN